MASCPIVVVSGSVAPSRDVLELLGAIHSGPAPRKRTLRSKLEDQLAPKRSGDQKFHHGVSQQHFGRSNFKVVPYELPPQRAIKVVAVEPTAPAVEASVPVRSPTLAAAVAAVAPAKPPPTKPAFLGSRFGADVALEPRVKRARLVREMAPPERLVEEEEEEGELDVGKVLWEQAKVFKPKA